MEILKQGVDMKTIKRAGIIGAGCLGLMYYNKLSSRYGNEDVFFIADKVRINRYKKDGIYCNGEKCDLNFVDKDSPHEEADLIMFANKFTTINEAIDSVSSFVGPETILISVLNGIASEEIIGERLGDEHLLYTVVHGMDATKIGNQVIYKQTGTVVFGDKENCRTEDVTALKDYFAGAEIDYFIPENIKQKMWSKLMLNVGVNQVAAVFNCNYKGLQQRGREREMMLDAMEEARTIAALEGIKLTEQDIKDWMDIIDKLSPEGMPSMQQDILAGKKTEVELFSGTIKKLGKKHAVETPVNDYLYSEIAKLEANF